MTRRRSIVFPVGVLAIALGAVSVAPSAAQPQAVVVEDLADVNPNDQISHHLLASLTFSPDRRRVAFFVSQGSRLVANIDGKVLAEPFDKFLEFTRDRDPSGRKRTPFLFSPDGQRVAFGAARSGAVHIVVDGQIGPPMVNGYQEVGRTILFSKDSKHLAYVMQGQAADGTPERINFVETPGSQLMDAQRVVVDGVPGPPFASIQELQFGGGGTRVGYIGVSGRSKVMVDGKEMGNCAKVTSLQFSADGKRVAYICAETNKLLVDSLDQRVVVDGKADRKVYWQVKELQWSKTGNHYAYVGNDNANRSDRQVREEAVVDGVVRQDYKGGFATVRNLQLSPDGLRHAYVGDLAGGQGKRMLVMVDGKPSAEYPLVAHLAFSKDSKHFAATVRSQAGEFLLFDGAEIKLPVKAYLDRWFFLDAGESAYAYPVRQGESLSLAVEGSGGPAGSISLTPAAVTVLESQGPETITFSPDATRNTHAAGETWSVNGKLLSDLKPGQFFHFGGGRDHQSRYSPDSRHVAFVGVGGGRTGAQTFEIYLDEVGAPSAFPAQAAFHSPIFSPDSRHFAYATKAKTDKPARLGTGSWRIILNGVSGPTIDQFPQGHESTMAFLGDGLLQVVAVSGNKLQRIRINPGQTSIADWPANAAKLRQESPSLNTSGAGGTPTTSGTAAGAGGTKAEADRVIKDPVGAARDKIKGRLGGLFGNKPK